MHCAQTCLGRLVLPLCSRRDATPGIYLAPNVGHAKVQGLEGSWSGHVGKTDVRASVTVQNPVDLDNDVDLVRRARRYNITKAWYVAAQIQNLLNKDYETAYSYNSPRRGAYLTVGWRQQ